MSDNTVHCQMELCVGISLNRPVTVKLNLTLLGLKVTALCVFSNIYKYMFSQSTHGCYVFYEVFRSSTRSSV